MTAFFGVHLVLTVVSLALGTIIGVLGIRALRGPRRDNYKRPKVRYSRIESAIAEKRWRRFVQFDRARIDLREDHERNGF